MHGMKTQGYSKNPGAAQVTSKGSKQPLGGSGSGRATPNTTEKLRNPADGHYSPKAVRSQQLQPGAIRAKQEPPFTPGGDALHVRRELHPHKQVWSLLSYCWTTYAVSPVRFERTFSEIKSLLHSRYATGL